MQLRPRCHTTPQLFQSGNLQEKSGKDSATCQRVFHELGNEVIDHGVVALDSLDAFPGHTRTRTDTRADVQAHV